MEFQRIFRKCNWPVENVNSINEYLTYTYFTASLGDLEPKERTKLIQLLKTTVTKIVLSNCNEGGERESSIGSKEEEMIEEKPNEGDIEDMDSIHEEKMTEEIEDMTEEEIGTGADKEDGVFEWDYYFKFE